MEEKSETIIIKKSLIYTRTGDRGTTSLYNGTRLCKSEDFFEALGTVDELNSYLGVTKEYCIQEGNNLEEKLAILQSRLLDVGSCLATPKSSSTEKQLERVQFDSKVHVKQVEEWIDFHDSQLPKLKNFILPSGGLAATHFHVCRTIARRAERQVVSLVNRDEVDEGILVYLNRLSDLFFVFARFAAFHAQKQETIWIPYNKSQ